MNARAFLYGIAGVILLLDLTGDRAALILTGAIVAIMGRRIFGKGR